MPLSNARVIYQDHRGYQYAEVALDLLMLDPENSRINPQKSSLEALVALVKDQKKGLLALAKDILDSGGTNPGEIPNVTPTGDGVYVVREANRRLAVRKILKNPELLRDHVSASVLKKWAALADRDEAKGLPAEILVVIGEDHDEWVDRRHLGPQGGAGLLPWDHEAKRRRGARRARQARDLPLTVWDALKAHDADRFGPLEPPDRTFTTWARVFEPTEARKKIGVELAGDGRLRFLNGERTLRILEQVLIDLRRDRKDKKKLTSRRLLKGRDITEYLDEVDKGIAKNTASAPITVVGDDASTPSSDDTPAPTPRRAVDVLRTFHSPSNARLRKILEELTRVRKGENPNAAIVLTRVLLELSIDAYANRHHLDFAGDTDPAAKAEVSAFWKALNTAGLKPSRLIAAALRRVESQPIGLTEKLEKVIDHLASAGAYHVKEAAAKKRELREKDTLHLLNDAIHRLNVAPSLPRVTQILEVVAPVYNAMTPAHP